MSIPLADIDVVAPNLKRRLSGVTATVVRLVPIQAQSIGIVATGPGLPPNVPHIPMWKCVFLRKRKRVWHARRNTEMLLGLFLRHVARVPLSLVFTSASQRHHTGYTRWLISRMDAVIATSSRTAAYLDRPSKVILHGIDLRDFSPASDKVSLRAGLNLPGGVLVGCYGRIREQKGTDAFVAAMMRILSDRPDVTALVMGRATDKHDSFLDGLKKDVCDAGLEQRILFLPEVSVDKMADWYRVLDLYVAPQRWEGFGLTPIEAMACGVPVVATRVGAFEEIVTPETGILIDPDDIPALADATAQFLDADNRRLEAGLAARMRVEREFRLEREANALISVYRDLLR